MSTRPGTARALLVIDVQVGVVADAWERDRVVARVADAVQRARAAGLPVIWVQHEAEDLPRETPPWQWVPELQPAPGEARIHKRFNSAFEATGLMALLDERHVGHLFLAGAATNACIRATAYGALERGFDVTLLSDAHTTSTVALGPGRSIDARTIVDDLNLTMRWLAYPGRANAAVPVAEASFGPP